MSQRSNMELIDNLRPFIAKIVQQQLGGGVIPLVAGNGVSIDTYYDTVDGKYKYRVSLNKQVEIEQQLRVQDGAIFELWDTSSQIYRQIRITIKNGQPFLEFAPANDWSGYSLNPDFTMVKDGWGEVFSVPVDSTVDFTDTSSPTEGWSIIAWEWKIELMDGHLPTFYYTNPLSLPFYAEGQWEISLTVTQQRGGVGDFETNSIVKYLEVI